MLLKGELAECCKKNQIASFYMDFFYNFYFYNLIAFFI